MNGTILLYWLLASLHPSSIAWVYVVNSLEQFGYGLGMAAYTVFLLGTVKQEHKAAHYAVATALMALGLMIPGMTSGFLLDGFKLAADSSVIKTLQAMTGNASFLAEGFNFAGLGYANFFLLSFCLTLPGIISICFLPIWRKNLETA
jgi:PAT family beta-lactamase induction signal transducer AmpG